MEYNCDSCELKTINMFKCRGSPPFEQRQIPTLYTCHNCKVVKCNNCIGNMRFRYRGDDNGAIPGWKHYQYCRSANESISDGLDWNAVPEGMWLEFHSRRFLQLHSCSQKCHDAYEEID